MFAFNAIGPVAHAMAEFWRARLAKRGASLHFSVISRGPLAGGAYPGFCLSGTGPVDDVSAARAEGDLLADLRTYFLLLGLDWLER